MVVNPSPGGGTSAAVTLTPYQILPLSTSSLVSVPATNLLYAAIPASSSSNPNTVIPIDPTTGTAKTPIPVGNNPVLMAASSDGTYLYVALAGDQTVQRINLQTNVVERTFPYSPNPFCTGCEVLPATDLETVPGSPQEVVLAQGSMVSLYNGSGLVNYVPNAFVEYGAPSFNSIAFAGNPLALYALPFTLVQNSFFTTASIGNTGLQYTQISGTNYGETIRQGNKWSLTGRSCTPAPARSGIQRRRPRLGLSPYRHSTIRAIRICLVLFSTTPSSRSTSWEIRTTGQMQQRWFSLRTGCSRSRCRTPWPFLRSTVQRLRTWCAGDRTVSAS